MGRELNQKQNRGCAAGKDKGYKLLWEPPTILLSSVSIKKIYSLADSNSLLLWETNSDCNWEWQTERYCAFPAWIELLSSIWRAWAEVIKEDAISQPQQTTKGVFSVAKSWNNYGLECSQVISYLSDGLLAKSVFLNEVCNV